MKKSFLTLFLGIISIGLFYGCAGTIEKTSSPVIKIKSGTERLVAREYTRNGGAFFMIKWCGNKRLIFRSEKFKFGLIDMKTGERTSLNLTLDDSLLNCTPDGKKLFYMDYASNREDGEPSKRTDIEPSPGIFFWSSGSVEDMYLYDIETHEKTLVASVHDFTGDEVLSPDGRKILFGNRHRLTIKKGGPDEWETVWFAREKDQSSAIWLPDSSGVVSGGTMYADALCVEFFGKDGWDKCFKQDDSMLVFKVDREGLIYYLEWHFLPEQNFLRQCVIKDRNVVCKRMLEKYDVIRNFDFMPGGDIFFEDYDNDLCVHRSTPEGKVSECVIGARYGDHNYNSVHIIGVSPNGRWLAFNRNNKTIIQGGKRLYGGTDLFVMELKDN
jgi:hypothetical protein